MVKVPKYYQVKSEILALIADLAPGSPVATERELAEQFETSRTTVRQAIAELVVDGRLERTQGRGTFVAQPKLMQVRQLTSFSRDLQAQGQRPGSVMLRIDEQPADDEVSAHLEVAPGTPIHRVERLRTAADEPIALLIGSGSEPSAVYRVEIRPTASTQLLVYTPATDRASFAPPLGARDSQELDTGRALSA